jgi:O-antigen/teichoic acid export membrane protein
MYLKNKAISGFSWTAVASIVSSLVQAFLLLIIARAITPAEYGVVGFSLLILSFVYVFADAGLNGAIISSQHVSLKQMSTYFYFNILAGILLFILLELSIPIIVSIFNKPIVTPYLQLSGFTILFVSGGKIFETVLQKELRFKALSIAEIVSVLLSMLVFIVLIVNDFKAWSLIGYLLSVQFFRMVTLALLCYPLFKPSWHFSFRDLNSHYIKFGLLQLGERTINLFAERLDQLIIGKFGTASILGIYTMVFNIVAQPFIRINPIISKVMFPIFAKIQNDNTLLQKVYMNVVRMLSLVNSVVLIGFIVVAKDIIPLILGVQWSDSVLLFQLMSVVMLLRSIGNSSGMLSLAKGNARVGFYWNLIFLIVSIPALIIGYKFRAAEGIAIALICIQILLFYPFYWFYIGNIIGHCFKKFMIAAILPLLIAGVIGASVIHFIDITGWKGGILKIILFELFFIVIILSIFKDERYLLLHMLKKIKRV